MTWRKPNAAPAGTGSGVQKDRLGTINNSTQLKNAKSFKQAFPLVISSEWPKIGPQANFMRLDNVVAALLTKLQRTLARPA
jgi:hypothetical protein